MNEFHKAIFFTKVPLGGYYKYRDIFQIYPCDFEDMPKSELQNHYPNTLEYKLSPEEIFEPDSEFEELKELTKETANRITKEDQILGILSAFSNNLFFRYRVMDDSWGVPILNDTPGKEADFWSSKWCMKMFKHPNLPGYLKINEFTKISMPEIKRDSHARFFTYYPNLDSHKTKDFRISENLDYAIDSYYNLEPDRRITINSAINNVVSSVELHNTMKTISLLCSFTAIETMANLEFSYQKPEKCKDCGQLKYSISKKFRDFLLKYIGHSDQNKAKFNKLYSLRSKIVHQGSQLETEKLFSRVPKEVEEKELLDRVEVLQIGKLSVMNWLLSNK